MKRSLRVCSCTLAFVLFVVAACSAKTNDSEIAPVPSQVTSANKVFIANGGSSVIRASESLPRDLPYAEFYAAVKEWGHFELVSGPSQAQLVLEISFGAVSETVNASKVSSTQRQLKLRIIDPANGITLWVVNEQFDSAALESNRRKDLEVGVKNLIRELKKLTESKVVEAAREKPRGGNIW